mmetsp:Transcript_8378/g.11998  ORF Transcript_8378/g.11998 Transcript_8378/m.11998 type:complete len:316 (-) Transcript_8378:156-1103(-)
MDFFRSFLFVLTTLLLHLIFCIASSDNHACDVTVKEDPKALYDDNSQNWARTEPNCLSDFTARPKFFELCRPHIGKNTQVLDLGCGEGYCTRNLRDFGPASIIGVDLSEQMIKLAKSQEEAQSDNNKIQYYHGNAVNVYEVLDEKLSGSMDGRFDLITAVFMFNYMSIEDMNKVGEQVLKMLKPGGRFIFTVPHPALKYWDREPKPPFYLEKEGQQGYFQDRNKRVSGFIFRRDGQNLPIQSVHKTVTDYFTFLLGLGFIIEHVSELGTDPEMIAKDPEFFSGVDGVPLHMAFIVIKPNDETKSWIASTRLNDNN